MGDIDTSLYCISCNPGVNWIDLEFRSECDDGIAGLEVNIVDPNLTEQTGTTNAEGQVRFSNVALGAVSVTLSTDSLLREVEKYPRRQREVTPESPVKARAEQEWNPEKTAKKQYRYTSIGDWWIAPPDDAFLTMSHAPLNKTRGKQGYGLQAPANQTTVYEIKAVRSLIPYLLDTDTYNLVTGYNMGLLSVLSYADYLENYLPRKDDDFETFILSGSTQAGYVNDVLSSWRAGLHHPIVNKTNLVAGENFLMKEVPYSHHLKGHAFVANTSGDDINPLAESSEAFVLYNPDTIVVAIRGSQEFADWMSDLNTTKTPITLDGEEDISDDAPYYAHSGFYNYISRIKKQINDFIKKKIFIDDIKRNIFIAGHSLGGAAACLYATFLSENDSLMPMVNHLRVFTYGEPRSLNGAAVQQKNHLMHYRHVNFADIVPCVPPHILGFRHHGRLIQMFTYRGDKQVLVLPSQSGIDTLGEKNKDNVENDAYSNRQKRMGLSLMDHLSGPYCHQLLQHLCAYLFIETSQAKRYGAAIKALQVENRHIEKHKLYPLRHRVHDDPYVAIARRLVYQHDTNERAIAWLSSVQASTLTTDSIVYGDISDPSLKQVVTTQIDKAIPAEVKAFREAIS
ncbi:lipase family protein [Photobacterium indicum]|uniref:lipase family protein n=1 Tax=Photobacterium indicum TaxID=81447 RepID=UPI003D149EC5